MAKIKFDRELMKHIKTIYGDADLDGKTLKNIYLTWLSNPEFIRNTARQKQAEKLPDLIPPLVLSNAPAPVIPLTVVAQQPLEVALDDLSSIGNFNSAFAEARRRGLSQFKWRKTGKNPSGIFGTLIAKPLIVTATPNYDVVTPDLISQTKQNRTIVGGQPQVESESDNSDNLGYGVTLEDYLKFASGDSNAVLRALMTEGLKQRYTNRGATQKATDYTEGLFNPDASVRNAIGNLLTFDYTRKKDNLLPGRTTMSFQQGGTMNNQLELQKAFMAYLILDAAAQGIQLQSEQDLQLYASQLGEEGLKAKYQEFMQKMQGGVMARLGAKLLYYKKLKGVCPEGEELVYFKRGGRICTACQKAEKGFKAPKKVNEIDKFKAGRSAKKNACGAKMKKR